MNTEALKQLIKDGLAAQQAGSKVAAKATDDIQDDATNSELRAVSDKLRTGFVACRDESQLA